MTCQPSRSKAEASPEVGSDSHEEADGSHRCQWCDSAAIPVALSVAVSVSPSIASPTMIGVGGGVESAFAIAAPSTGIAASTAMSGSRRVARNVVFRFWLIPR
jgi:hypothetical protein